MSTVAHLARYWLPHTQTFIYRSVAHARRYKPVVYTEVYLENLAFEVNCTYCITRTQADIVDGARPDVLSRFLDELDYPSCFENSCREQGVSVLHAHFGHNGEAALSLKRRSDLPLVTSFYGIDASRDLDDPGAYAALFSSGDLFLALGDRMARRLEAAGCPADRLRTQPLSIDPGFFKPEPVRNHDRPPRILFCGRLVEKKRLPDLFDAFDRVFDRRAAELLVIGDGPLRVWCEDRAVACSGPVRLLGKQPQKSVRDWMSRSDVFVLPSATAADGDAEGTPTVLLEAQASGLPVVSTRHADIPAVVKDGVSGILVPERAPDDLAEAILALIDDPGRRARMGAEGRATVRERHDIQSTIDLLESAYDIVT